MESLAGALVSGGTVEILIELDVEVGGSAVVCTVERIPRDPDSGQELGESSPLIVMGEIKEGLGALNGCKYQMSYRETPRKGEEFVMRIEGSSNKPQSAIGIPAVRSGRPLVS